MSFWEDLSPAVKGYLGVAAVLIEVLIAYQSCAGSDVAKPTAPRGYQAPY